MSNNITKNRRGKHKRFSLRHGTDGCDERIEIVSKATGGVLASFRYGEETKRAASDARRLIRALETGHSFCGEIDVRQLMAEHRKVAVIWSIEDVQIVRPELTCEQCWEVLQCCEHDHSADAGINWDFIEHVADKLFDPADQEARHENDH
jgi:hypothetical protein